MSKISLFKCFSISIYTVDLYKYDRIEVAIFIFGPTCFGSFIVLIVNVSLIPPASVAK